MRTFNNTRNSMLIYTNDVTLPELLLIGILSIFKTSFPRVNLVESVA